MAHPGLNLRSFLLGIAFTGLVGAAFIGSLAFGGAELLGAAEPTATRTAAPTSTALPTMTPSPTATTFARVIASPTRSPVPTAQTAFMDCLDALLLAQQGENNRSPSPTLRQFVDQNCIGVGRRVAPESGSVSCDKLAELNRVTREAISVYNQLGVSMYYYSFALREVDGLASAKGCPPVPTTAPPSVSSAPVLPHPASDTEYVRVQKYIDFDKVIIVRRNGETWLLDYGVGCISLSLMEGRQVLVYSPGLFAGIGARIIIPDHGQDCRIWNSDQL